MLYTDCERNQLKKVISVFNDYIQNNPALDLLYSDKMGYLFVTNVDQLLSDQYPDTIEKIFDAQGLCYSVFWEMFYSTLEQICPDNPNPVSRINQLKILEHCQSYILQLPEYQKIFDKVIDDIVECHTR